MQNLTFYKTEFLKIHSEKVQFLFESEGRETILKAVEYSCIAELKGRKVYNLGFGEYDEANRKIIDNVNSNNGDMRKVFNTVLNTIPKFFQKNKNTAIWVRGSDSAENYKKICKPNCTKNCDDICKNFNRRIKTYRYFVDKNFVALSKDYIFFGLMRGKNEGLVQYVPNNEYVGILVYKKK